MQLPMPRISLVNIGYWLVTASLLSIAFLTIFSTLDLPIKLRFFVVQTGSMEPAIKIGSLALVQPADSYNKGEVITFQSLQDIESKKRKTTVTHRIADIESSEGAVLYITKGDANKIIDSWKVSKDLIIGKVTLSLPYLGYPVSMAKTQWGFILLIVIPATIIVYSELMNIKNEAKRLLVERKSRKLTVKEEIEEKIGDEIITVEKKVKKITKKL